MVLPPHEIQNPSFAPVEFQGIFLEWSAPLVLLGPTTRRPIPPSRNEEGRGLKTLNQAPISNARALFARPEPRPPTDHGRSPIPRPQPFVAVAADPAVVTEFPFICWLVGVTTKCAVCFTSFAWAAPSSFPPSLLPTTLSECVWLALLLGVGRSGDCDLIGCIRRGIYCPRKQAGRETKGDGPPNITPPSSTNDGWMNGTHNLGEAEERGCAERRID